MTRLLFLAVVIVSITSSPTAAGQGQGASANPAAAGPPDRPASLGPTDSAPRLIRAVAAAYPSRAKNRNLEGEVWLQVIVKTDGSVGGVQIEKSLDTVFGLDQSAIAAVRQWQYAPALMDGKPVPRPTRAIITFMPPPSVDPPSSSSVPEVRPVTHMLNEPGLVPPRVKHRVDPVYTTAAMRKRISGTVQIQAIVLPDGTVGWPTVTQSLDAAAGLDDQALGAAREWIFEPATLENEPVAVTVVLALEFRLR